MWRVIALGNEEKIAGSHPSKPNIFQSFEKADDIWQKAVSYQRKKKWFQLISCRGGDAVNKKTSVPQEANYIYSPTEPVGECHWTRVYQGENKKHPIWSYLHLRIPVKWAKSNQIDSLRRHWMQTQSFRSQNTTQELGK